MNHKCEACRFWKAQTDERDMGECRRRAPAPARAVLVRPGDPPVSWAASWPVTGAWDSCGEFSPLRPGEGER